MKIDGHLKRLKAYKLSSEVTSINNRFHSKDLCLSVCLFVCLFLVGVFVSHWSIFHSYEDYHYWWRDANFTYARHTRTLSIEGSVLKHLMRHGASICDGDLRGPMTLTPVAERWQWSFHYLFLRIRSVAAWIRTPKLPLVGQKL